jgi:hypothetical protein
MRRIQNPNRRYSPLGPHSRWWMPSKLPVRDWLCRAEGYSIPTSGANSACPSRGGTTRPKIFRVRACAHHMQDDLYHGWVTRSAIRDWASGVERGVPGGDVVMAAVAHVRAPASRICRRPCPPAKGEAIDWLFG